jgi:hypothetical protein
VTIFSYDGKLCWGLNADFDLMPDLDRFSAALERSFHELLHAAGQHDPQLVLVS